MIAPFARGTATLLLVGTVALAGCASTPDQPCVNVPGLSGTWQYQGVATSPEPITLGGTVVLQAGECGTFDGTVDLLEQDQNGSTDRVAGPVHGQMLDAKSVQFDAFLDAAARQHFGTLAGDSVTGTWVEGSDPGAASGSFTMRRAPTP